MTWFFIVHLMTSACSFTSGTGNWSQAGTVIVPPCDGGWEQKLRMPSLEVCRQVRKLNGPGECIAKDEVKK